ncbi:MAG: NAD(P)H-binding protein [Chromatiales bacterium]|nr:NAD(P)H-binding protein [Chromatiales bacterium]
MKVALIGATGFVGAPVLAELLSRGHAVTVLARIPVLAPQPGLTVVAADALDAAQVAAAVAAHDAVVSAYNPGWLHADLRPLPARHPRHRRGREAGRPEAPAAGGRRRQPVCGPGPATGGHPALPRRIQAGRAGARGAEPAETGNLTGLGVPPRPPSRWRPVRAPPVPPGAGRPSARRGRGARHGISVADRAVAIVDEIETPRHIRQRFTVAN